jgi:branched-chain amino acid transport system ATP-binding protein
MSAVPVLETRGLGRRFGGLQAVSDVSFSVPAGQVLGVIGPNGAGKSTFINLVTGHIKPTEGRVLIDGKDLTGARPWVIAQAGVARTFQIVKPFRGMSVRENVAVGILYGSNGTNVMSKALRKCLRRSAWPAWATAHQVSFPSPTPGGWSSPRRSRFAPGCSCSMR